MARSTDDALGTVITLMAVGVFGYVLVKAAPSLVNLFSGLKASLPGSGSATPYGLTGQALENYYTAMNAKSVAVTNAPGGAIGPMPATSLTDSIDTAQPVASH